MPSRSNLEGSEGGNGGTKHVRARERSSQVHGDGSRRAGRGFSRGGWQWAILEFQSGGISLLVFATSAMWSANCSSGFVQRVTAYALSLCSRCDRMSLPCTRSRHRSHVVTQRTQPFAILNSHRHSRPEAGRILGARDSRECIATRVCGFRGEPAIDALSRMPIAR